MGRYCPGAGFVEAGSKAEEQRRLRFCLPGTRAFLDWRATGPRSSCSPRRCWARSFTRRKGFETGHLPRDCFLVLVDPEAVGLESSMQVKHEPLTMIETKILGSAVDFHR